MWQGAAQSGNQLMLIDWDGGLVVGVKSGRGLSVSGLGVKVKEDWLVSQEQFGAWPYYR